MLGGVWNYHLFILMDCELFVLIGWGGLCVIMLLLGSIDGALFTADLGCISALWLSSVCTESFHAYWSFSHHEGQRVKNQTGSWNDLSDFLWMSLLYVVRVGSVLQHYSSLQGVGVTLHHARPRLPVAVLYPSLRFVCLSPLILFSRRGISPRH